MACLSSSPSPPFKEEANDIAGGDSFIKTLFFTEHNYTDMLKKRVCHLYSVRFCHKVLHVILTSMVVFSLPSLLAQMGKAFTTLTCNCISWTMVFKLLHLWNLCKNK